MPFINFEDIEEREIIKGFKARFAHSENMTFANWNIKADHALHEHSHVNEQISSVIEGRFELTIDGESKVLEPGMAAVIPSNVVHSGRAVTDCKIIDVFCPVREDYKFE